MGRLIVSRFMVVRGYLGRFGSDIGILEGEPEALTVRPGPAAARPSYLALSLDGRHLYAAIGNSSPSGDEPSTGQVSAYAIDDDGGLGEASDLIRHSGSGPNADRQAGPHAHMIVPDPSGAYILALRLVESVPCGGAHPRDFVLASGRLYVANQHSDVVTTFRVDAATGTPEPTGRPVSTPAPSCVLLLRDLSVSEPA